MPYIRLDKNHKCKYDEMLPFNTVTVMRDDGHRIPTVLLAELGAEFIPNSTGTSSYFCSRCGDKVGDACTWGGIAADGYEFVKIQARGTEKPEPVIRHRGIEIPASKIWSPCVHDKRCIGYCPQCIIEFLREKGLLAS